MSSEPTAVADTVCRVLVVGDSPRIDAVMDALSTQFDSVSLFRERTVSNALERLSISAFDVHCVVCAFDATAARSTLERVRARDDSLPIVAVAGDDQREVDRALEAGATDVVTADDPESLVAARVQTAAERERYRLAAEASTSRYRSVLEGSNAIVWVVDDADTVTYASPATESRLGVTPDELERTRPTQLVHPDDRDDVAEALDRVSSGPFGTSERVAVRLRHADRTWRAVDLHAVNRFEDPHVQGLVVTIAAAAPDQPLTEPVRAAIDRLDAALFALGSQWELEFADDAASALFAGEPERGTVVWDLLPESMRSECYERFREARATASVVEFETAHPDSERSLRVRVHPSETGVTVYAQESTAADGETVGRDRLDLLESVVEALDDGIAVLDGSTITVANAALIDLSGAETLVGRDVDSLFDETLAAAVRERARSPIIRWMDPIPGNLVIDEPRPVDVFVVPLSDVDRTLCIVRDGRRSPARAAATIEEAVAAIRDADGRSAVRQAVVDAVLDLTDADLASLYRVDDAVLRPAAVAVQGAPSSIDLPAVDRSVVPLEAIREAGGGSVRGRRSLESFLSRSGIRAEQVAAVPVGDDVLFATSGEPLAFESVDLSPVETLAEIAAIALDERESASRAREARRERAVLESTVDRFRHLRTIEREVLRANTREQVERRLCEGLTDLEIDGASVELAWIGTVANGSETLTTRRVAGRGEASPEPEAIPVSESTGDPAGRTAATLEPTVVEDLADATGSWTDSALERGFRSALSAPLVFDDFLYGTVTAYADRPAAFDDRLRRAITHLATVGAYAIGALETRRALLSDGSTELELVLRDETEPLSSIAQRLERGIDVRSVVPRSAGGATVFATVGDVAADAIADSVADLEVVESIRPIGDRGDETLVEFVLAELPMAAAVAEHGGVVRSVTPTDDRTRIAVELASTVDVRPFVQMLERTYPRIELVARRERDRSLDPSQPFDAALRERLSERQLRTLEAAYYGGFFAWPRESTGEEVADSLGVSQPTFSRHVRIAQGKLFSLLFDERDDHRRE